MNRYGRLGKFPSFYRIGFERAHGFMRSFGPRCVVVRHTEHIYLYIYIICTLQDLNDATHYDESFGWRFLRVLHFQYFYAKFELADV